MVRKLIRLEGERGRRGERRRGREREREVVDEAGECLKYE